MSNASATDLDKTNQAGEDKGNVDDININDASKEIPTRIISKAAFSPVKDIRAVIAIDFGTTHSGYAYATVLHPDRIYLASPTASDTQSSASNSKSQLQSKNSFSNGKEPSCALFRKDTMELLAYGASAKDWFLKLQVSEKMVNSFSLDVANKANVMDDYYYFEAVKIRLFFPPEKQSNKPSSSSSSSSSSTPPISAANAGIHHKSSSSDIAQAMCSTVGGKSFVPLKIVVSKILNFLKDQALEHMLQSCPKEDLGEGFDPEKHIQWVLTVPAIADEEEKHFMRECSLDAGLINDIQSDKLMLALEPECCAIAANSSEIDFTKVGTKLMCIDAGGGTVDICCLEVDEGSMKSKLKLKQILTSSGGSWGSRAIDIRFREWFDLFIGKEILEEIFQRDPSIEISLMNKWEEYKLSLQANDILDRNNQKIKYLDLSILLPELSFTLRQLCDSWNGNDAKVSEYIKSHGLEGDKKDYHVKAYKESLLSLKESVYLYIKPSLLYSFFEPVVSPIVNYVANLLERNKHGVLTNLGQILLVGGFGNCSLLRHLLRQRISEKVIILTSTRSGAMTVAGAVMYGLQPGIISSRISKYTIGIKATVHYDMSKHNSQYWERQRFYDRATRQLYIRNVFVPYVLKNESVDVTQEILHKFKPRNHTLDEAKFELYYSEQDQPPQAVTDDGCKLLCSIIVKIQPGEIQDSQLQCSLNFGATEFTVTVTNLKDGNKKQTFIKYNS